MLRAAVIAVVGLIASQAQASFIVGEFSSLESGWQAAIDGAQMGDALLPVLQDRELEEEPAPEEPAPVPPPPASMSGGQNSIGPSIDRVNSVVALISPEAETSCLSTWLRGESQIEIPAAYLDRVFRPPRC